MEKINMSVIDQHENFINTLEGVLSSLIILHSASSNELTELEPQDVYNMTSLIIQNLDKSIEGLRNINDILIQELKQTNKE